MTLAPPPGLRLLMLLQAKAVVRRAWRGAGTLRGGFFLFLALLVLAMWLGPAIWMRGDAPPTDPHRVRLFMPLILLASCVTTLLTGSSDRAIAFTPAEVDFLFAAPVSRRQLLFYKLAKSAFAHGLMAAPMTLIFMRHGGSWIGVYLAIAFSLALVQLLNMAVLLTAETVGKRLYSRLRIVAVAAMGALVVWAFMIALARQTGDARAMLSAFVESTPGRIALAPFAPFAWTLTATGVGQLVLALAGCAAVLGLLVGIIFHLDADYLEASIVAGRRAAERTRQRRSGGWMSTRGAAWRNLPMFPRLGGAGAMAWRQTLKAVRGAKGLLIVLLILVVGVGPSLWVMRDGGGSAHPDLFGGLVAALAWATVFLSGTLRMDFRGDLDVLPMLRQLPISPMALTLGQLAVPIAILTICQGAALTMLAVAFPVAAPWALAAIALAAPFNTVVIGVENLVFLLYPSRAPSGPGDLQGFGRQIALMFLKVLVVAVACGLAFGAGALALATSGRFALAAVAAISTLLVESLGIVALVRWAFVRFNPSAHTAA